MIEILGSFWTAIFAFLLVLTILVYVHEMGHYLAARQCKVRVEVFSVGFGPEIFGRTSKSGTRWKLSAIPFGGYVKMFGESRPDNNSELPSPSEKELSESFFNKPVSQRVWIVVAGPLANFLFAIMILSGLFIGLGEPHTPANISKVIEGSAAARAGLKPGDIFIEIDGKKISRFEEVRRIIELAPAKEIEIIVERAGEKLIIKVIPDSVVEKRYSTTQRFGRLGVARSSADMVLVRHDPFTALWKAVVQTFVMTGNILDAIGQIILGERNANELGGPIKIAQISGAMAEAGFIMFIQFAAILSINLGLINLFPIPLLDGGHLVFYGIEALRGRPVNERIMALSLNIGLALILCLTVFVTWNDLVQMQVSKVFSGW